MGSESQTVPIQLGPEADCSSPPHVAELHADFFSSWERAGLRVLGAAKTAIKGNLKKTVPGTVSTVAVSFGG